MLALEHTIVDEEAYRALHNFNKLVLQFHRPIFCPPGETSAASFHHDLLEDFDHVQVETIMHEKWCMQMAQLDTVQHTMLQGSPKWRVAWVKAFGKHIDNPFRHITKVVQAHPEVLNVMLSRLEPSAELPKHQGPFRGVMRYHLGLVVPEGDVGLEVEDQTYVWRERVGVTFDDTLWHRAWNHTPSDRVVLFADVLRPLSGVVAAHRDRVIELLSKSKALTDIRETIVKMTGKEET